MRPDRALLRACAIVMTIAFHHSAFAQSSKPELRKLDVGAHSRVYTVEALGGPAQGRPRPIIVELHGSGTDVRDNIKNRYFPNFTVVADIEAALLVKPQGANRVWDPLPAKFDDWRRLSGTDGVQVDDIAFIRAVVADVVAKDGGDPRRAFLYGVSVGGQMAARVACEMADEFRAVASLIANAFVSVLEQCANARPIPYLLLASRTDPVVAYGGMQVDARYSRASVEQTVASFARRNGCRKVEEQDVPHADPTDGMTAIIIRHTECTAGADVLFYRLDGSGHELPSRVRYESDRNNKINRDVETSQELWSFFKRYMN